VTAPEPTADDERRLAMLHAMWDSWDAPEPVDLAAARARSVRDKLAEAFIRGLEVGAEAPWLASDGDAMGDAFRTWAARRHEHDLPSEVAESVPRSALVQVGWYRCDCPPYETSPHANAEPTYVLRECE
jgi:hypothetical protein